MNNKKYNVVGAYIDIDKIKKAISHIEKSITNYEDYDSIAEVSEDDLDNILYRSEKLALSCRKAMEYKENDDIENGNNIIRKSDEDMPVRVEFDDNILKIYTPFTLKRMYRDGSLKENYVLMNYVCAALKKWQEDNNFDLFMSINLPLDVYIIRRKMKWNRNSICDHDNLENGRIINEIFLALGYSDSPKNVDLHCMFRFVDKPEDEGMLFLIKNRDYKLDI